MERIKEDFMIAGAIVIGKLIK